MKQIVIYRVVFVVVTCTFLLVNGCSAPSRRPTAADEQAQSVKLSLKLSPGDSTTYKVAVETVKSVEWEGQAQKPKGFQGGQTSNKMEMTFSRQIESVEDQGNAVAKITIKGLKYITTIKSKTVVDFDSSRETDHGNPLNKLIGQSYTIEITPSGEVSRAIDTSNALAVVAGNKTAVAILSTEAIKQRHTIPALPARNESQLQPDSKWSNIKSVSFNMMGAKTFERIYTLDRIDEEAGHRIALVNMEAVPSVENARESYKGQTTDIFSRMFDNKENYTGKLKFDLTDGKVAEYSEKLVVQWFIVDQNPKDDELPAALKMAATRSFRIEKID